MLMDLVSVHTATLLPNGKVLVAGGTYTNTPVALSTTSAELYDPTTGIWTLTGSMNVPRASSTATLLSNGKVLVAGGKEGDGSAWASAELYDPSSGTWSLTSSMTKKQYKTRKVRFGTVKKSMAAMYLH